MGDRGGSWATAGCAAFSLAGLLVGIGLTAWLGSAVLGGATNGAARPRATSGSTTTATAPSTIRVAPDVGLTDQAPVVVTGESFRAEEVVAITVCVDGVDLVVGSDGCDADTTATSTTDVEGRLRAPFVVPRVATAGGLPFDCAEQAGRCRLRVTPAGDPSREGSAPLAFATGLGPPEITLPD